MSSRVFSSHFRLHLCTVCMAGGLGWLGIVPGCGGEPAPSLEEAMSTKPEDQFVAKDPKPRPTGMDGPTEAEFKAWNRVDREGEKHLYKWDKANLNEMLGYWEQLECLREVVRVEGEKAFGAEPGSPTEEQWFQFKRMFITHADGWQKRLFAEQPRILEKSKFISHFLEAHELVMHGYPKAFNEGDKTELEKADAHWIIIEAKISKYVKNLGGEYKPRDPNDAKAMEKHAKVCQEVMQPPDRGKVKKRKGSKSPI